MLPHVFPVKRAHSADDLPHGETLGKRPAVVEAVMAPVPPIVRTRGVVFDSILNVLQASAGESTAEVDTLIKELQNARVGDEVAERGAAAKLVGIAPRLFRAVLAPLKLDRPVRVHFSRITRDLKVQGFEKVIGRFRSPSPAGLLFGGAPGQGNNTALAIAGQTGDLSIIDEVLSVYQGGQVLYRNVEEWNNRVAFQQAYHWVNKRGAEKLVNEDIACLMRNVRAADLPLVLKYLSQTPLPAGMAVPFTAARSDVESIFKFACDGQHMGAVSAMLGDPALRPNNRALARCLQEAIATARSGNQRVVEALLEGGAPLHIKGLKAADGKTIMKGALSAAAAEGASCGGLFQLVLRHAVNVPGPACDKQLSPVTEDSLMGYCTGVGKAVASALVAFEGQRILFSLPGSSEDSDGEAFAKECAAVVGGFLRGRLSAEGSPGAPFKSPEEFRSLAASLEESAWTRSGTEALRKPFEIEVLDEIPKVEEVNLSPIDQEEFSIKDMTNRTSEELATLKHTGATPSLSLEIALPAVETALFRLRCDPASGVALCVPETVFRTLENIAPVFIDGPAPKEVIPVGLPCVTSARLKAIAEVTHWALTFVGPAKLPGTFARKAAERVEALLGSGGSMDTADAAAAAAAAGVPALAEARDALIAALALGHGPMRRACLWFIACEAYKHLGDPNIGAVLREALGVPPGPAC